MCDTERVAERDTSSDGVAENVPDMELDGVTDSVPETSSEGVMVNDGLRDIVSDGDFDIVGLLEIVTDLLCAGVSDAERLNLSTREPDHDGLPLVLFEPDGDGERRDDDASWDGLLESLNVMDSLFCNENVADFVLLRRDFDKLGSKDGDLERVKVRFGVSDNVDS